MRSTRIVAGGVVIAAALSSLASPAQAWPSPLVQAHGGGCAYPAGTHGSRTAVLWMVTNRESSYPRSPATIQDVVVTPAFLTTPFDPAVLPNTGRSTGVARTSAPDTFSGVVKMTGRIVWDGPDGSHAYPVAAQVTLRVCPPPRTTTTTSSATTRSAVSTSTTAPAVSTTSTTQVVVADEVTETASPAPIAVHVQPKFTG